MTAHTPHTDAPAITARIAQLPHLPMDSLWALWDEHFDERPNHHHRTWLESRLAYKIQERALGGLKSSVRRKLEEIGETGILPRQLRRDANRLLPGTVLTRFPCSVDGACSGGSTCLAIACFFFFSWYCSSLMSPSASIAGARP